MARPPKLKNKAGYWYSEAGGQAVRFGRVGLVSYAEAKAKWREHLGRRASSGPVNPAPNPAPNPVAPDPATADLIADFLAWVDERRGRRAHEHRQPHLLRWADHVGPRSPAATVAKKDMEAFLADLKAKGYAPDYIKKHFDSVNAMYTWAVKHGKVPAVKPFAAVEPVRVPNKVLSEHDLPTAEEVARLFEFADADLDPVLVRFRGSRHRERGEWRAGEANPFRGFEDMLRVYHGTGARTYELCDVLVGDFQPRGRQIVLGKHKTMHVMKKVRARQISLTGAAFQILERLCHGRGPEEPVFVRHNVQKPWDAHSVAERFLKVRKLAGVRDTITPYSFRHLFISQMLQAGVDVFRVAKMSGNSVEVIESTYGHLRTDDFQSAVKRLEELRSGDNRGG